MGVTYSREFVKMITEDDLAKKGASGSEEKINDEILSAKKENSVVVESKEDKNIKKEKETEYLPNISLFLAEERLSLSKFVEILKIHKVKRFRTEDIDEARKLISENDGAKIWAIVSQKKLHPAIDSWVWNEVQAELERRLKIDLSTRIIDFSNLVNCLKENFEFPNRIDKQENYWFRISICWLIERRSIKSWDLAEWVPFIMGQSYNLDKNFDRKVIAKGKQKEFMQFVNVVAYGQKLSEERNRRLDQVKGENNYLKMELEKMQKQENLLHEKIDKLSEDQKKKEIEFEQANKAFANQSHNLGQEVVSTEQEFNKFLNRELRPRLQSAFEYLEEEPYFEEDARKDIEKAIEIIDKKIK